MMSNAADAEAPLLGLTLSGKYTLEEVVGIGAMGAVYRAAHLTLDKTVAVKVLHPSLAQHASFVERFKREAFSASRLDHPNSLRVLDFGVEPERGLVYLVLDYVEGEDLLAVMEREWPLEDERVVNILSQTLAALAVAHDLGIVHRDLKPENILLLAGTDDEGRTIDHVKVCDFGIAKLALRPLEEGRPFASHLTTEGLIVGTPDYMSPEQARGIDVDGRSDLYSIGCVLYHLLAGRTPFTSDSPLAIAIQHVADPPVPPSTIRSVHPALEAVCLKALSKRPADRYPNAREMRRALRQAVADTTSLLPSLLPPGGSEPSARGSSSPRAEPAGAEPTRAEPSRPESSRAEPSRVESSRAAPGGPITKPEPAVSRSGPVPSHVAPFIKDPASAPSSRAGAAAEGPLLSSMPAPTEVTAKHPRDEATTPRPRRKRAVALSVTVVALAAAVSMLVSSRTRSPGAAPLEMPVAGPTPVPAVTEPPTTEEATTPAPASAPAATGQPGGAAQNADNPEPSARPPAPRPVGRVTRTAPPAVAAARPPADRNGVRAGGGATRRGDDLEVAPASKSPAEAARNALLPLSSLPGTATSVAAPEAAPANAPTITLERVAPVPIGPSPTPSPATYDVSAAYVAVGAISTTSGISVASIRSAVAHFALTSCYRRALRAQPNPSSMQATLSLSIDISGRVVGASLSRDGNLPGLRACVEGEARGALVRDVDTGEGSATVTLTFNAP